MYDDAHKECSTEHIVQPHMFVCFCNFIGSDLVHGGSLLYMILKYFEGYVCFML